MADESPEGKCRGPSSPGLHGPRVSSGAVIPSSGGNHGSESVNTVGSSTVSAITTAATTTGTTSIANSGNSDPCRGNVDVESTNASSITGTTTTTTTTMTTTASAAGASGCGGGGGTATATAATTSTTSLLPENGSGPTNPSSTATESTALCAVGGTASTSMSTTTTSSGKNSNGNGNSPRSPKHARRVRIKLSEQQLETATREELAAKWREQDLYVECLEAQAAAQEGELVCLRDSEEKYRQQCCEVSHRERILVRRLASKEQQLLEYVNQITELRAAQTPSSSALRSALLDPAVNILIEKLRQELSSTKAKLEDTQNELSAWKFTPDSNTGKRLMAKCRLLYQENEELGRMIASGRIAKLEGELALQKSFSEEVKKSQSELDEFLQDLDEDVEGMQSTIYFLQQELRKARESVSLLQQENSAVKSVTALAPSSWSSSSSSSSPPQPPPPPNPPPPPPRADNNLSNGLSAPRNIPTKKEESNEDVKPPRTSEDIEPAAIDSNLDFQSSCTSATTDRSPPKSSQPLPVPPTTFPSSLGTTALLNESTDCESIGDRKGPAEELDESSNDSAALIIKVENEELSDREDDEEEEQQQQQHRNNDKKDNEEEEQDADDDDDDDDEEEHGAATAAAAAVAAAAAAAAALAHSCETRGSHRQSTRRTAKSVVGKSNGEDRASSRPSSRRLVRDRRAKRDKSGAADSDDERRVHKKTRRESILSIDYNETEDDDALLLTNGESIQSDPEDGP